MAKILKATGTALLAGVLALPVIAQTQGNPKTQATTNVPQSQVQAALSGGQYDQQIQREVNKVLSSNDWAKNIRASVEDGIVTLKGQVPLYADKVRAYDKIHNKDHVQGVRNLVEVAGKTVPDKKLMNQLADKLRYDRVDQGIVFNNFNLAVKDGVVTIGGQARTPWDAASALAIVRYTPGVKGVIDNIKVLPVSPMDDATRIRVAEAIYGSSALSKYAIDPQAPIRIVVDNGNVTLYGVVDNQMDKTIADMRAKEVPGVFSVTNKLVVANERASN